MPSDPGPLPPRPTALGSQLMPGAPHLCPASHLDAWGPLLCPDSYLNAQGPPLLSLTPTWMPGDPVQCPQHPSLTQTLRKIPASVSDTQRFPHRLPNQHRDTDLCRYPQCSRPSWSPSRETATRTPVHTQAHPSGHPSPKCSCASTLRTTAWTLVPSLILPRGP